MSASSPITLFGQPRAMMTPPTDDQQTPPSSPDQRLVRDATEWFMRQSASDFSADDRARLDAWRRASPAHDRAFRRVAALWESPEMTLAATRLSAGALGSGMTAPRRQWAHTRAAGAVAATVLLVSLALWFSGVFTRLQADYATAVGERRVVTLPDESVATLNTDSAVSVRYRQDRRVIQLLQGEASFAVRPDADRPFTVEAHGVTATALGTEFLVRDGHGAVQVTVLHGSVEVASARHVSGNAVRLQAGDHVVVGPEGPGAVTQIDATGRAAWRQGRLVFVRAPLAEVIQELSRYHRGYLGVWNPALENLPVTGIYDLTDPSRVVTTLAETLPIHVVRLTDHLVVIR